MKYFLSRTTISAFVITTILGLSPMNTVNAQENSSGMPHNESKEKNKEIIKTEQFDEWKKSLTPSEEDALEGFKYSKINELIKKVDGNIDFIKGDLYVNVGNTYKLLGVDGIREVIRNLDTALMKSKKIEKDIHVFRYLTEADVDFRIGDLSTSFHQSTINRDKYKLISQNFKYGFYNDYLDAYLTEEEGLSKSEILLDLKLPKGTHVGFLNNKDHILLSRNQGILVTNSSIIVINGKEKIKVEAELIDKNLIKNKIQTKEDRLNDYFRKIIEKGTSIHRENEIPTETKLIELVTNSLNASFTVNRAETLLHTLTQNIPSDLLLKTLEQMNHRAAITITDSSWENLESELGQSFSDLIENALAFYDHKTKELIVNLSIHDHEINPFKLIRDGHSAFETDVQTLIHEFGHAVDDLILNDLSQTSEFIDLYQEEKGNIKIEHYMTSDQEEFFASAFSYIFSPNTQYQMRIKQEAPKTVAFIQKALEEKGLYKKN
ncbi:ADP-ribosyltransferase [Bacillus cereus group sp. MYBK59-1]|uniref:ADP-ribosyltransferase n=1 Tax=Bacillus cereus group sp. MYBK59-1 TaxID=3450617 RepID=UPI002A4357E1|nr:hypothetical protein [Bacillus cereus]MDA2135449.1 hypothetical protein [Bacillus cereus]